MRRPPDPLGVFILLLNVVSAILNFGYGNTVIAVLNVVAAVIVVAVLVLLNP